MTRIMTTNYAALTTTQFMWATVDGDLFDREFDLYRLAQAVEFHDHSNARGLAVARVGAGVVDNPALAALAVATANIQALAVTNSKLGAAAVTYDKITWPMLQPSNDMAGGYRQRETAGTYAFGFYMAANGLAVIGAGTPASIPGNLVLGQAGQVSVGTQQGAAPFNVFSNGTGLASGFRLYNTNTSFFTDFIQDSNGNLQIYPNGASAPAITAQNTSGKVAFGITTLFTGRMNLRQGAGTQAEGWYQDFGAGNHSVFIDGSGHVNIQSALTNLILMHTVAALAPLANNGASLGQTALRWLKIWTTDLDVSGTLTVAGGGVPGAVPLNGIIIFRTAAERTAAGASWVAYSNADGRILVGAGTTFSQTFTEATDYGSNWTPLTGVTTSIETNAVVLAGQTSGANTNVTPSHAHTIPSTTWLPPMRAVVYGRRNT